MPGKFEAQGEKKNLVLIICCVIVGFLILAVIAGLLLWAPWKDMGPTEPTTEETEPFTEPSTQPSTEVTQPSTEPETEPTTQPTEPPIVKEATATITAVGDILPHMPIVRSYNFGEEGYIFDEIFRFYKDYISSADLAIANLETTLAGNDNGYEYWGANGGVLRFNTPDSMISALKNAGFDMLLTANNHSYDTRGVGFQRTQQILNEMGLPYVGTRLEPEAPEYVIQEVNGIRIGFLCYTYETGSGFDGWKSLNGIGMSDADAQRISSFAYDDLPGFYTRVQTALAEMEVAGAEASVVFIHWGNEYQITQNSRQSEIAQGLCDLGVDVIIGGHPHVIQPMELLTSTADPAHKTVCLYSTGNALSNQRRDAMDLQTGHTEDGVLMQLSFSKYSDGTVILESVDLVPTWVHMIFIYGDTRRYTVYALDDTIESWQEHYELDDGTAQEFQASYDRTMAIVGQGLNDVQSWLSLHTSEVEAALGVKNDTE